MEEGARGKRRAVGLSAPDNLDSRQNLSLLTEVRVGKIKCNN